MAEFITNMFNKIIDKIKDPIVLSIIFIISSMILFLPTKYIKLLNLEIFVSKFGYIFGLLLLISVVGLFVLIISKINQLIKKIRFHNKIKKYFKTVTPEEKIVLSNYIHGNKKTNYYSIENGVVNNLKILGILYISSQVGGLNFPYTMRDFSWKYLNKNKHLLSLTEEEQESLKQRGFNIERVKK